jgi:hypothetical protein
VSYVYLQLDGNHASRPGSLQDGCDQGGPNALASPGRLHIKFLEPRDWPRVLDTQDRGDVGNPNNAAVCARHLQKAKLFISDDLAQEARQGRWTRGHSVLT